MATTAKGHIERLPSGSYRVKVYAGTDPVTGRERRLRETCPDEASAAAALARLLKEAEGHQVPERAALFGRVLDVYLEVTELSASTRPTHESYIRRIIRPVLGDVKARKIGPGTLDALNAHLKRCFRICSRLPRTELRWRPGPPEMMNAQYDRLIRVAGVGGVGLRVLPFAIQAPAFYDNPITIYEIPDDPAVLVEGTPREQVYREERDLEVCRTAFSQCWDAAFAGDDAIRIIEGLQRELATD